MTAAFAPARLIAVAAGALLLTVACVPAASAGRSDPTNPLVGKRQFIDCGASHTTTASRYSPWWFLRRHTRHEALLSKVARVPQVKWFAGVTEMPARHVERYLAALDDPQWGGPKCATRLPLGERDASVGDYPIVAIRRLVHGNCLGMRKVGSEYKRWIDGFIDETLWRFIPSNGQRYEYWKSQRFPRGRWVRLQEGREMTVILEPDGVGLIASRKTCLKRSQIPSRLALLRYASRRLSEAGFNVYIDAGSSTWLPASRTIRFLRAAGVRHTRGFALNSTHFNRTRKEIAYGDRVAKALGKRYVVNTAENANGSLPKRLWGRHGSAMTVCNPRNAGLGAQPTTATGSRWADAFLWISRPGLSANGKQGGSYLCGPKQGPRGNMMWLPKLLFEARQASFEREHWPPRPL